MGEVVTLPVVRIERLDDGGKARILRKRDNFKFRTFGEPTIDYGDDLPMVRGMRVPDLSMDHADPGDSGLPSDSAYSAPDSNPA